MKLAEETFTLKWRAFLDSTCWRCNTKYSLWRVWSDFYSLQLWWELSYTSKRRYGQCTPNELQRVWRKSTGKAMRVIREWENVTCQEILTILGVLSLKKRRLRENMMTGCKNTEDWWKRKSVSNLFSISMVRNGRVWEVICWTEPNKIQIRF